MIMTCRMRRLSLAAPLRCTGRVGLLSRSESRNGIGSTTGRREALRRWQLNNERAEERRGIIRWLRPEFSESGGAKRERQTTIAGIEVEEKEAEAKPKAAIPWPKDLPLKSPPSATSSPATPPNLDARPH